MNKWVRSSFPENGSTNSNMLMKSNSTEATAHRTIDFNWRLHWFHCVALIVCALAIASSNITSYYMRHTTFRFQCICIDLLKRKIIVFLRPDDCLLVLVGSVIYGGHKLYKLVVIVIIS